MFTWTTKLRKKYSLVFFEMIFYFQGFINLFLLQRFFLALHNELLLSSEKLRQNIALFNHEYLDKLRIRAIKLQFRKARIYSFTRMNFSRTSSSLLAGILWLIHSRIFSFFINIMIFLLACKKLRWISRVTTSWQRRINSKDQPDSSIVPGFIKIIRASCFAALLLDHLVDPLCLRATRVHFVKKNAKIERDDEDDL